MYSIVSTASVCGIESVLVQVEADVCDGMPVFEMVGELSNEVKEAKERIRVAIRNTGIRLSPKRITINLYPAELRKSGTGFDLPIALAVLAAYGHISSKSLEDIVFAGEISLNGDIHPIDGVLPMTIAAKEAGKKCICIPKANDKEAGMVGNIQILPAENLQQLIQILQNRNNCKVPVNYHNNIEETKSKKEENRYDFQQIRGQKVLKRVCEIAAAGRHNLLMLGPPGGGKTAAARAIPGILPELSEEEELELAKIYSVSGMFGKREENFRKRPFCHPHHTISVAGMAGGGKVPKPGEISLAHNGVLFLDEMTEFQKAALEVLRQPLEEGRIHLVRNQGTYSYPADIMLVAAMNPCNCGYYPNRNKCTCTPAMIRRHLQKISRPLLDRIDLCVEVQKPGILELTGKGKEESSREISMRIKEVQRLQDMRYENSNIRYNSRIPGEQIENFCPMEKEAQAMLAEAFESLELSVRGYYKVIRVARTIADLEGKEKISSSHIAESLMYRNIDGKGWTGSDV